MLNSESFDLMISCLILKGSLSERPQNAEEEEPKSPFLLRQKETVKGV
jgi:hypothetical protein